MSAWKPAKAYAVHVTTDDHGRAKITVLCPHCTKSHTHSIGRFDGGTAIRQPPCGLDVAYRVVIPTLNLWPAT